MPRKKAPPAGHLDGIDLLASMRPGHCAPEKGRSDGDAVCAGSGASMRPGHCAPEKGPQRSASAAPSHRFNEAGALCPGKRAPPAYPRRAARLASMRPGHCAPEKGRPPCRPASGSARFNEAGALCPGKSSGYPRRPMGGGRFNEAGALCPGKRVRTPAVGPTGRSGFNEAGALCPGKRANHGRRSVACLLASMRPGHCAPEKAVGGATQISGVFTLQ